MRKSYPFPLLVFAALLLIAVVTVFAVGPSQRSPSSPNNKKQRIDSDAVGSPCPQNRNLTASAKYGVYVIRTYRFPDPEGCLQILQSGKVVYSLMSVNFAIGNNFEGNAPIRIGTDITGEGKPDGVVSEWTGGAHCCFIFHVFELGDVFREIAKINAQHSDGASFVDPHHDGHYEFEGNDWAFAYWKTSFAESPAPRIILKYRDGRFRLALDLMERAAPSSKKSHLW
jgi:hypothetical protein